MKSFLRFAALALAASLPAAAFAQISINAPPPASFSLTGLQNPTEGSSAPAYAQTFQTPDAANTRLDSFAFYLAAGGGAGIDFSAYVMDWNAGTNYPIGAPLWTSSLQSAVGLPAAPTFTRFAFDTGGLVLDPATTYSLVLFAQPGATADSAYLGVLSTSYYSGGLATQFYGAGINVIGNISSLGSAPASSYDLAFDASFSAPSIPSVPEPSTAGGALIAAFVAVAAFLRLRRRRVSALTPGLAPEAPAA